MTDSGYQYSAELGETALPEVLYTIYRHKVAGEIELRHRDQIKKLSIHDGSIVDAWSASLSDSLGQYLRATGQLSEEQFQQTDAIMTATGQRHGVILVEEGILAPSELYQAMQAHLENIVYSVFGWTEGKVTFRIGEPEAGSIVRISLPLRGVILEGVKRSPEVKKLVGRLGGRDTVFQPAYSTEDLIEVALDADEFALLRRVDGKRTIYELCTGGTLAAPDAARRLYAFHVLHLIRKKPDSSGVVKIKFRPDR